MRNFAALLLMVVAVPVGGWALQTVWGWFLTPVFGVPTPALWTCAGIRSVAAFLTHKMTDEDEDRDWLKAACTALVSPPLYVGLAWVIYKIGGGQ